MKKLEFINERMAVFSQNDYRPDTPLDPFAYINGLLSIRSARGLIEFLRDNPHRLGDSIDIDTAHSLDGAVKHSDSLLEDFGYHRATLGFSEKSLLNAAGKCRVDYFDNWSYEEARDASGDADEYYYLLISDLASLSDKISALLYVAHMHYEPSIGGSLFEYGTIGDDADLEAIAASCEFKPGSKPKMLTASLSTYARILPPITENHNYDLDMLSTFSRLTKTTKVGSTVLCGYEGQNIIFLTTGDKETAIKDAAGILTAAALNEWVEEFGMHAHVICTEKGKLKLRDAELSAVVYELIHIIEEDRIGICSVCGMPFVTKKKPKDGAPPKIHCTNSCKTKASIRKD